MSDDKAQVTVEELVNLQNWLMMLEDDLKKLKEALEKMEQERKGDDNEQ